MNDGYKIYSCSKSLLESANVTPTYLQYLNNIAQKKQSYVDPTFMDDAYLYYTPDEGDNLLCCFHPVHFDSHAEGDYSKRRGNFVNQILIGDFSEFYPYETFGDRSVWNAKEKGEAYYYATPPEADNGRSDIDCPSGGYYLEQIRSFIGDGRQRALSMAVAFLLEQYSYEPENRKYLVIQDDSTEKLELWIAAIESAFSPRMASGLPFATRMDKFMEMNKYTVNQTGAYQSQLNFQDPRQKLRYRAMIVGVNKQDPSALIRAMPAAPYVILDGTAKKAMFEADISDPFFSFITRFDEEQVYFCREFLQIFGISQPTKNVCSLYDDYKKLRSPHVLSAKSMANIFCRFNLYSIHKTKEFDNIYRIANSKIEEYLQSDPTSAVSVMDWIIKASSVAGDRDASDRLTKTVCNSFAEALFIKQRLVDVRSLWSSLRGSSFAADVAYFVTDKRVWSCYSDRIKQFTPEEAQMLFAVMVDCTTLNGTVDYETIKFVTACCAIIYGKYRKTALFGEVVKALSTLREVDVFSLLLDIAKSTDKGTSDFIVNYLVTSDRSIIANEGNMTAFCQRLRSAGMKSVVPSVIKRYVNNLTNLTDLDRFARNIANSRTIPAEDRPEIYTAIDNKLSLSHKAVPLAMYLQKQAYMERISLPISAHLAALAAITERHRVAGLKQTLEPYIKQGVPSVEDENFVRQFATALARERTNKQEEMYICDFLLRGPSVYFTEYLCQILDVAEKQLDRWQWILDYCDGQKHEGLRNTAYTDLIHALVYCRLSRRTIDKLSAPLTNAKQYFDSAVSEAEERLPNRSLGRGFANPFSRKK
jgi:hypothetical protein